MVLDVKDKAYLKKYRDVQRNIDGSPAAFSLTDIEFRGKDNKRINKISSKDVRKADMVNIKCRF